jgi:type I restriction enzyme S subunit
MSFPRYPKYKDSGVEWLGQVPEHWELRRLKNTLHLLTEKTDRRGHAVALENIESWTGRFITTETEFEGEGVAFQPGDILFGKLRPYLAKAFVADSSGEAVGDFHVMRPVADIESRFAQYQILNREFIAIVDGSTFGSKMPRASWEFVGGMKLTTPPRDEQTLIASFLDRETAKIDGLVAEQQRLIELLREKRQAVISHAVAKGLNPHAPMKPSGIEWLGDVPAHWEVVHLRRLAKTGTSITYGIVQAGPDIEDGIPYIRTSDMAGESLPDTGYMRTTPEIDASYARSKVRANDLVVAIRASLGKGLLIPDFLDGANLTQGTARICPGENLKPRFLLWSFNSDYCQTSIRVVAKGTTFLEITLDALRRIPLAVPPLPEQVAIVAQLDRHTAQLDTLTAEAQRAIDLLQERRTALISAAVTGKIDVRGLVETEAA